MNVYDFDGTLLDGDTEDYFFEYLFQKRKDLRLCRFRYQFWNLVMRIFSPRDKTWFRERQYRVLRHIPDLDRFLSEFWAEHRKHLKSWFRPVIHPDDIIASATPRFLLEPILPVLGVTRLVATDMDSKTGKVSGHFTSHQFKTEAFRKQYDLSQMDNFYSDTYSDHFMADLAKQAYAVHGEQLTEWKKYFCSHYQHT